MKFLSNIYAHSFPSFLKTTYILNNIYSDFSIVFLYQNMEKTNLLFYNIIYERI